MVILVNCALVFIDIKYPAFRHLYCNNTVFIFQCYIHCILNTYNLLNKDLIFDWEGGISALKGNAPESIAGPGAITIENCKDAIKTKSDKCIAGTEVAKCLHDDNPAVNIIHLFIFRMKFRRDTYKKYLLFIIFPVSFIYFQYILFKVFYFILLC
nr:unnamed protein product [Callosobruchus analis]